jgi:hypothetical protein
MSVHNEIQNLKKNKSGNATLGIKQRSGDTENGSEYFDLCASATPSAFDIVQEQDERQARQKFLTQYFTLLKQWLNRFEFEYVKQLYFEGQDEKTVFDKLGLQPKRFKESLKSKLCEHSGEVQRLAERSEWEDAELFSRTFLASPTEILNDDKVKDIKPKTVKGFGNLIKAHSRREHYLQLESDRYYERKVYSRGYAAGKYNTSVKFIAKLKPILKGFTGIIRAFSSKNIELILTTLDIDCDKKMMKMFFDIIDSYNTTLEILVNDLEKYINDENYAYTKVQRSRVLNIEEDIKAEDERNEAGA